MLTVLEMLAGVLLFSVGALALPALLVYGYVRTRTTGLRAPGRLALLLVCWLVAIVAAVLFTPGVVWHTSFTLLCVGLWAPMILATGLTVAVVRLLPSRGARVFGRRRVRLPFVAIGTAVIVLCFAAVPLVLYQMFLSFGSLGWDGEGQAFVGIGTIWLGIVAGGSQLIRLGRRVDTAQASDISALVETRPGALYLRSFRQESQWFVVGPAGKYRRYAKSWHAAVSDDYQNVGIRFDEYFEDAVTARLGPLVALGSPADYVPPGGARRLYASDVDWKERVEALARSASSIVMEMGDSGNLRWELEFLRENDLQDRLFILTRPATGTGRFVQGAVGLLAWMKKVPPVTWQRFAEKLSTMGYSLDEIPDPGPGAVIGFDAAGTALLLTTGADSPDDYVRAICAHLQGGAGPGHRADGS